MDIQVLVDDLARLIKRPITVEDTKGALIAYSAHEYPVDPVRMETLLRKGASKSTIDVLKRHGVYEAINSSSGVVRVKAVPEIGFHSRIAVAVRSRREVLGYLWVKDDGGPLLPQDEAAIIRASKVMAHNFPGVEPLLPAPVPRACSFVEQLLSADGKLSPAELRARSRGWELNPPFQVMVMANKPSRVSVNPTILLEKVDDFFKVKKVNVMASNYRNEIVIIVSGESSHRVKDIALDLSRYLDEAGFRQFIGLGCAYTDLALVQKSYHEASESIIIGARLHLDDDEPFLDYGQVALYDLVRCMSKCKAKGAYGRELVRHIVLYDRLNGTELIRTLEALLDYGGKRREAAKYLNVHPNTLDYRLKRINQMFQSPLDDPSIRLAVHLWIKAIKYSTDQGENPRMGS